MEWATAQQAPQAPAGQAQQGRGGGGGRGNAGPAIFTVVDANKDGAVTRDEMKTTFDKWFTEWDSGKTGALTQEQLRRGSTPLCRRRHFPPAGRGAAPTESDARPERRHGDDGGAAGDGTGQAQAAAQGARPRQGRRLRALVDSARRPRRSRRWARRRARGRRRSPTTRPTSTRRISSSTTRSSLRARPARSSTIQTTPRQRRRGERRSSTSCAAARASPASTRRLTPITRTVPQLTAPAGPRGRGWRRRSRRVWRRGDGRRRRAVRRAGRQERRPEDQPRRIQRGSPTRGTPSSTPTNAGRVSQADFPQRFAALMPAPPAAPAPATPVRGNGQAPATNLGPDNQVGTWPEFNTMIGGFFKFHWNDGQDITVKVDDPNSPLTAMFKGKPQLVIVDETYTMARDTYSRKNLHVLTSIDYAKMTRRGQGEGVEPASRRRLRPELDSPRRQGPRLLRSARPQRKDLREHADSRAHAGWNAVCSRRSAGRR